MVTGLHKRKLCVKVRFLQTTAEMEQFQFVYSDWIYLDSIC